MNTKKIALLIGGMCCLLTIGICIQIKTVSITESSFGKTQTENELRDSVSRWQQKYKNAYEKLGKSEKELESLREKVSNNSEASNGLSKSLEDYNALLGYTELVGQGIVITLEDGDPSINKGFLSDYSVSDYIVHDGDVLEVINALRNAGADAISINGQRIISSTAITCIGNVIKVNGEKIGTPYVINAIGPTTRLYSSLKIIGGYLSILEDAGVKVDVKRVEKETIVIPKYEGVYKFEYASKAE